MENQRKRRKEKKKSMSALLLSGCVVGIFAALVSVAYRYSLGWAENARTQMFEQADSLWRGIVVFLVLIAAGLLVGWISQREPMIKGSGIPQVEGQLMGYFSPRWLPVLIKKFVCGTICIFAGLSLGREGPSVQLGSMAAQGFSEATGIGGADKKYLMVCGACAGLAAAFNAPLAGLMFALEEIHRNFSRRAVFPAMAAAMCADIVSKLFFGTTAVLNMVKVDTLPLRYYLLYLAAGIVCGCAGALYNRVLLGMQKLYKKIPVPDPFRIAIPFAVAGVAGFTFPMIMGGGHGLMDLLAGGQIALSVLILLLIGKFLFSMVSFCSGAPGGIFFPLLVLGALIGSVFARLAVITLGIPESYGINFMLLGMTGLFAATVKAPLTGIVLVAEMSGSLTQFIGLALVACTACLTASMLKSKPIYEQLLNNMIPYAMDSEQEERTLSVMDIPVPVESRADGKRIKDLELPEDCHIIGVLHAGGNLIPKGGTILHSGDVLSIVYCVGTENEVHEAIDILREE